MAFLLHCSVGVQQSLYELDRFRCDPPSLSLIDLHRTPEARAMDGLGISLKRPRWDEDFGKRQERLFLRFVITGSRWAAVVTAISLTLMCII